MPKPRTVQVWPENATIAFLWLNEAGHYWQWMAGGMGPPMRMCLDWWRIKNITLDTVPAVFRRDDLKKRKARFKHICEGLRVMEQAALSVFFQAERERQAEDKRKRDMEKSKQTARRK